MPIPFLAFVFVVGAEYFGLGNFIPLYKKLPIPLLISFSLVLYVASQYKIQEMYRHKQVVYYTIFIMLTASAMLHGLIQSNAIEPVKTQIGYFMLTIIACFLVEDRKKYDLFAMVFVVAHILIVLINLNKLGQTTRTGSFSAPFFMGDGNDLAWSLNIALPFALYLGFTAKNNIFRLGYFALALLLLLGIVGTQSRGAFLALGAGLGYYFFYITKKKASGLFLVAVIIGGVLVFAPSNYFNRMQTITHYEEDGSAMGRIKAWRTATEMAIDNPILGVGAGSFNSSYGRHYRKHNDPVRWISTHSVYFKILAEYGFTGLFIYLMIIFHNIKTNTVTARLVKENLQGSDIDEVWPKCLNWSIITCSVAAMFLSGVSYPHLFILTGLTLATSRLVKEKIKNQGSVQQVEDKTPWEKVQENDAFGNFTDK